MRTLNYGRWIQYVSVLILLFLVEMPVVAETVVIEHEARVFQHEGLTYKVIDPYAKPLKLALIDVREDLRGNIVIPEELYITTTLRLDKEPVRAIVVRIADNFLANWNEKNKNAEATFLIKFDLPSTVRSIGDNAFASWDRVNRIILKEGLENIGAFAFKNSELWDITIPESVIYLGYGCFQDSRNLRKIILPSTLKALGGNVFSYTILEDIYCYAATPPIADESDFGLDESLSLYLPLETKRVDFARCRIHVPAESVELYKNAPGWEIFFNIVPLTDEDILSSTERIEESLATAGNIDYTVNDGNLTVATHAGDKLTVYDTNGICLQQASFASDDTFSYKGSGIVILYVNNNSVTVAL
ncbi:MAG: leucine-rich repeat domain-containing protein [Bacteroides sp.]|nr:leucine-rich repeat domain-containing protein [Bacteroides sp.]